MSYLEAMEILSQCGLGAVLVSKDKKILQVNEAGDRLLYGGGKLVGAVMPEDALLLCEEADPAPYVNVAFGEYLCRCATPELSDLPSDTRLIVFRVATNDACHEMLLSTLNGISEAVTLFDEKGRFYLHNDAAATMDSIVAEEVRGKHTTEIYHMQNIELPEVVRVLQDKRPKLNQRQYYTTCFGKNVDIVANILPILHHDQTLGAFCVMEDWSIASELHKKIIDLQSKILKQSVGTGAKEKGKLTARYQFHDIIHASPEMNQVVVRCQRIAQSDSSVMIYGETGTGKELLAQSIHNASHRANAPFLAINCAAIPENLLEGLLFGTEKGAYTGAESRAGLFEQANGGTLLLDEINSMNILLQSKLLRVLQDGMVRRVGGIKETYVDVRVLSNINIRPYAAIEEHKLRRDLFYRLGVININIPPLRDHKEDIPLLSNHFILALNKKLIKNVQNIDSATLAVFHSYHWPGNVRELEHAIEQAMNLLPDDEPFITLDYIPDHIRYAVEASSGGEDKDQEKAQVDTLSNTIQNMECQLLQQALLENGGHLSKTAQSLGMSRQKLQYRMKRCDIDVKALIEKNQNRTEFVR